jgi:hypothetical protein
MNILNGIHPDLKYEILEEIYVRIFKKIKGLSNMPLVVLGRLAQNAEECDFAPGEIIIDVLGCSTRKLTTTKTLVSTSSRVVVSLFF